MAMVIRFVLIAIGVQLLAAAVLIWSQKPDPDLRGESLDFSDRPDVPPLPLETIAGQAARFIGKPGDQPLAVFVHGSGWHGGQFDGLAAKIAADGLADVLVPDLRGHGVNPERRGDIDYIGQFEDDLAALIGATKKPGQKVVMIGHSSGGGLVVRMAGGEHGAAMDHAILLAPFLKYNAPTTRENAGGWTKVLTRRVIGLSMINAFRIKWFNGLEIIQFRFPSEVLDGPMGHTATRSYSYRLNTSFAPRSDYKTDIAALPAFDLIVGTSDESFVAKAYEPLMSEVTSNGTYHQIDGANHLKVVDDTESYAIIAEVLERLKQ